MAAATDSIRPGKAVVTSGWRKRLAPIDAWWRHAAAKPTVWLLCLLPALWLVYGAAADRLGPNPAEALVRSTGLWTLKMLCVVLAVTPLRRLTGWNGLARLRRMLGLYVYFYAALHLLAYAWLDMGLEWADIVRDIPKRPFILVGFAAFVGLTLLAATSFQRAMRWLGGARWQRLHKLVYAIAGLGLLHFLWMRAAKHREDEVLGYALVIGVLLLARVWHWWQQRTSRARVSARGS